VDGQGTWNSQGGLKWFDSTTGTYGQWGQSGSDVAVFGVGIGTVSGPVVVGSSFINTGGLIFNATGGGIYDLTGSGTINLTGASTITANADARIDAAIQATAASGLTVYGTGSIYLKSVYGTSLTQAGGGTTTVASFYGGPVTVLSGKLVSDGWTGVGIPSQPLTVAVAGTFALNGTNYSARTIVGSGIIENGSGTAATFIANDNSYTSSTFSGSIRDGGAAPLSLSLSMGSTTNGSSMLTLPGMNTYSGQTLIAGYHGLLNYPTGVIQISSLTDGGNPSNIGASSNAASYLWFSGGILQYVGPSATTDRLFTIQNNSYGSAGGIDSSGTGPIHFTNTGSIAIAGSSSPKLTLTGTNTGDNTLSPSLGSSASIWKEGTGTWILAGNNTYTGPIRVDGGILAAGSPTAFGNNSAVNVLGGATVRLNGYSVTLQSLSGGGTVDNASPTPVTLTVGSGSQTQSIFTGSIQDGTGGQSLNLIKTGSGSQTLSGTNTYTGPTTVAAGVLQFTNRVSLYNGSTGNWSTGNLVVQPGATMAFNVGGNGEFTASDITGFLQLGSNTSGFRSGSNIGIDVTHAPGAALTYSGDISDTNAGTNRIGVTALGLGTLTLAGNNNYRGPTVINGGILVAGSSSAFGNNSAMIINGTTVRLNGFSTSIGSLAGNGGLENGSVNPVTLTVGGDNTSTIFLGGISNGGSGALALTKVGMGSLELAALNNYSGPTTVAAGTLNVSGSVTSSVTVLPGATLLVNGSTNFGSSIFTSNIILNGSSPSNPATLGGSGGIQSAVTLNNLGNWLSPGNSPGELTFVGNQNWNSFTYKWELNSFVGTTHGQDYDHILVSGALSLAGTAGSYVLSIASLTSGNVPGTLADFSEIIRTWDIITASDGIIDFDSTNWAVDTSGFGTDTAYTGVFALDVSGNNLQLSYTPVPEPNSMLLVGMALGAYLAGCNRRSARARRRPH